MKLSTNDRIVLGTFITEGWLKSSTASPQSFTKKELYNLVKNQLEFDSSYSYFIYVLNRLIINGLLYTEEDIEVDMIHITKLGITTYDSQYWSRRQSLLVQIIQTATISGIVSFLISVLTLLMGK